MLLLALATCSALGQVWIVDDDDPGADFTAIQAAVDFAADGDVVLVRSGVYDGFSVAAKSLDVVGIGPVGTVDLDLGFVEVTGLTAGQRVVLSGLTAGKAQSIPGGAARLLVDGNQGSVWIQRCLFHGRDDGDPFGLALGNSSGARVIGSAHVVFSACELRGGEGFSDEYELGFGSYPGAPGLDAIGSQVAVYDGALRGGDGGFFSLACDDAEPPGPALRSWGSTVFVSGGALDGGGGAVTGAFAVDAVSGSSIEVVDAAAEGGWGGFCFGSLLQAPAYDTDLTSSLTESPGAAHGLEPFPLDRTVFAAGETIGLRVSGAEGELAQLAFADASDAFLSPLLVGPYHLGVASGLSALPLGTLPASGFVDVGAPAPDLGGLAGLTVFLQGLYLGPGQAYAGEALALTLLATPPG
ncbi:MAG: hypothetical protein AAF682_24405 [Planctomycetota bacterium]